MTVRIEFDRGTLLLSSRPPAAIPPHVSGVRWDARVDRHRAPARFHRRILEELDAAGIAVEDAALALHPLPAVDAPPALRPYQAAALEAWTLAGRRGTVGLPTGSGKTYVAAAAIAELGGSTLCLVPTRILLEQWHEVLARLLRIDVGRYGDGLRDVRPVTVATYESGWRRMHELGNRFELLIVDEAHHFGLGRRDEALEMSTAACRLGLTATPPSGEAAEGLAELVGPLVFQLSIADLAGTYLASFEIVDLRLGLTEVERTEYESAWAVFCAASAHFRRLAPGASWGDFLRWAGRTPGGRDAVGAWHRARGILSLTEAKKRCLHSLLDRHRDSRTLVFTADKEAAYRIARELLVMPITADVQRRERAAMLAAFQEGSIRALVSARVLNEGLDVPAADVGIIVGGAHGEREHVQRIGRLLRPAAGKRAVVYELVTRGTNEIPQARRRRRGFRTARPGPL